MSRIGKKLIPLPSGVKIQVGQELEAGVLLKAVKLYLDKRLDVYWGVVREV